MTYYGIRYSYGCYGDKWHAGGRVSFISSGVVDVVLGVGVELEDESGRVVTLVVVLEEVED